MPQARDQLVDDHRLHFAGRPGQESESAAVGRQKLPGRGAMWIRHSLSAFEQIGLAQIVLRHGPIDLAEPVDENRFLFERENEFAAERRGHGIARHIVFGGAEAADQNDDVRTFHSGTR